MGNSAPNIALVLKEMVSADQVESLLTGHIDVGFLRPPIGRGEFSTLRVAREGLVAALPSGDERLAKAALTLADFDKKPLVMYSPEGAR
jgi:DNA-binding transcriptional LysR family regulator